ncbi:Meiotically up-regulated gene 157 (Mug157) protein [Caloramator quimbayensis]|uniref:Meiotically up-regulated gene 157 (Mug157) protein n=1 Tax=Caloramator quimbayensis TaxID=1147123 RepID=A0A1T4WJW8_9CLOT|nr:glycoside hydrolase family 125 protein [Caloramator quimbayensis]SKA77467.1 Meiotically up-regulated gene 157 (Mug157) protein [Caloramator quimbayensis]
MKKILTTPKEIDRNERVLYAGNHYISIPEINVCDASIKSVNIVSLFNKALTEIYDDEYVFKPEFYVKEKKINIEKIECFKENYYISCFDVHLEEDINVIIRIYADLCEKGFVYEFESYKEIYIKLICNLKKLRLLRFNSHNIDFKKEFIIDKWLNNPAVNISSNSLSFAMAFGGDRDFNYEYYEDRLILNLKCKNKNAFYITMNSDVDGASTTLIHFKRKGFENIYLELKEWLCRKKIEYRRDLTIERILNENLFFNYFFAVGKDMESDKYISLTSRSHRYYVSGAFWERDSFLWSFPALKLVDIELYKRLLRDIIIVHSKNAGDHAHYIDGTVLYPGFELDEAASYFISVEDLEEYDREILKSLEFVLKRIEREYDESTMLYKTFLLPSDDPSEYPFVTIDNVILQRGFINLSRIYEKIGQEEKAELLKEKAEGIRIGIYKHLVKNIDGKDIFVWSCDKMGNFKLYNDPPGNLGLLPYYGFIDYRDEIFKNTIEYYYSERYRYYFKDARIKELACDHHPNTPSGLGLCGSILNPIRKDKAIEYVKLAVMDYGLLSESFDKDSTEAKTGVGFATGSGYLAMALYEALIKNADKEEKF